MVICRKRCKIQNTVATDHYIILLTKARKRCRIVLSLLQSTTKKSLISNTLNELWLPSMFAEDHSHGATQQAYVLIRVIPDKKCHTLPNLSHNYGTSNACHTLHVTNVFMTLQHPRDYEYCTRYAFEVLASAAVYASPAGFCVRYKIILFTYCHYSRNISLLGTV